MACPNNTDMSILALYIGGDIHILTEQCFESGMGLSQHKASQSRLVCILKPGWHDNCQDNPILDGK